MEGCGGLEATINWNPFMFVLRPIMNLFLKEVQTVVCTVESITFLYIFFLSHDLIMRN